MYSVAWLENGWPWRSNKPAMNCVPIAFIYLLFYLRARDCCECFVFKYTHALTVQWMRNFQYCTKRSWVQYWKLRAHCTVSKCVYSKNKKTKKTLSKRCLSFKYSIWVHCWRFLQWPPARPVWMREQWTEQKQHSINIYTFVKNL